MVKHFREELRKEKICYEDRLLAKAALLRTLRKKDLIKDTKRHCLKRGKEYKGIRLNINEFPVGSSPDKLEAKADETAKEVYCFKVALTNAEEVLRQLAQMKVKNERPADYLVEMYKSDKQMFKVRRYLAGRDEKIKEKMQGKDWESNNKRREKAIKNAEVKRERKKSKNAAKKAQVTSSMNRINGKRKVKK